jgi:hypothetical protein
VKHTVGIKVEHRSSIDHGRSDEPGCGANWKNIARFEKLENLRSVFQNSLVFLGQTGKASLSEIPEIYGSSMMLGLNYVR